MSEIDIGSYIDFLKLIVWQIKTSEIDIIVHVQLC